MKLQEAWKMADLVVEVLKPFCDMVPDWDGADADGVTQQRAAVAIAGSIRRGRPEVNDIDIVCVPKPGQLAALKERAKQRATVKSEGDAIMILELRNGMQLDIYFARNRESDLVSTKPGNFGTVLLCRTGSKEHNVVLAQRAQSLGLKWETMKGLVADPDTAKARVVSGETEKEIFQTLGMEWIAPALRERG
jgi:DNA polymerase/3'-5' exonuclease PolX